MAQTFQLVGGDARRALEEFSTEFSSALMAAEGDMWARNLGLFNSSNAIRTTYPLPISAALFRAEQGNDPLRRLYQRSTSIIPSPYVDGVEELARIIEAPDFIGWAQEPQRIAVEARRFGDYLTAQMLETNAFIDLYKDPDVQGSASTRRLFAADHPVNIFDTAAGTFDNDLTISGLTTTLLETVFTDFLTRKAPNGQSMRLRPTHLLVPPARFEEARRLLESDMQRMANLAGGSNTNELAQNLWRNSLTLIAGHELTDANLVYFIDASATAPKPWILQQQSVPEEIIFDKNSDKYKETGYVALKYRFEAACVGALPHGIVRVDVT